MNVIWRRPAGRKFILFRMGGLKITHAVVKHDVYQVVWKIHVVYWKAHRHFTGVENATVRCGRTQLVMRNRIGIPQFCNTLAMVWIMLVSTMLFSH